MHPPSLSTMLKSAPTLKGGRVNGCSVADYNSGESAGIVIPQVATASYRPDQVGLIMRNKDWDYSVVPPHLFRMESE